MADSYSARVWLNKDESASTGSAVAYHGETDWGKGPQTVTFFEVADCCAKVRLHKTAHDTMAEFISKLRLLSATAEDFATYLESQI